MSEDNNKKNKGDKVLVDKKQLSNLMARLDALESGEGPVLRSPDKKFVRIRLYKKSYVIGWGEAWKEEARTKLNTSSKPREFIEIVLLPKQDQVGEDSIKTAPVKKTVDLLKYLEESHQEEAEIIETMTKTDVVTDGFVEVTDVEEYSTVGTGVKVPNEVITTIEVSKIKLENGREYRIPNNFLNS